MSASAFVSALYSSAFRHRELYPHSVYSLKRFGAARLHRRLHLAPPHGQICNRRVAESLVVKQRGHVVDGPLVLMVKAETKDETKDDLVLSLFVLWTRMKEVAA